MRRIALLTVFVWLVGCATASATPLVVAGGQLSEPAWGLAPGADGSLWHTSASTIGLTTTRGETVDLPLPKDDMAGGAVTLGPDLAQWFTDARGGAILRVTQAGKTETVASVDGAPLSLATGPDGNVWFTLAGHWRHWRTDDDDAKPAIGRVTPDGIVTLFAEGLSSTPYDIAAGADGAMWFTEPKADRVGRITLDGAIEEFAVTDRPGAIVAGPDNAMWFTARKAIGRIDAAGTASAFADGMPSSWWPIDISPALDGALWFTTRFGIGRITPAGAIATYETPGLTPGAIALGGDGALWFTDQRLPVLGRIGSLEAALVRIALTTPVIGRTFVVAVTRGEVRIRIPGEKSFAPLAGAATLPVGTIVDATDGRIELRSALPGGKTQTGSFYGGRFEVLQPRKGRGLVRLALRGPLNCRASSSLASAARKRRGRRLWGIDLGGLFETIGLDSITTVRGTRWLTEDRCNGTFTRVKRGSVVVRIRGTRKRIVLHAGERYLAKRRP